METKELGTIRTILRSEITWIVFLITTTYGFVTTVVLPLQKLQIQIASVQLTLLDEQTRYSNIETRIGGLEIEYAKMSTYFKP